MREMGRRRLLIIAALVSAALIIRTRRGRRYTLAVEDAIEDGVDAARSAAAGHRV